MNKKILIVRGDKQDAKALSFLLAGSGYQISTHSEAGTAVEAVRHQHFDLVITDEAVPENRLNLELVSSIKEVQPALPVFFIAKEQSLETVINCIRAGVTEVIPNPSDLRCVIETTNAFLRKNTSIENSEDEVTWSDILEVERMLDSSNGVSNRSSEPSVRSEVSSAEIKDISEKLEATLQERDRTSGELATTIAQLQKSQRMVEELKNETGNQKTDTEINDRAATLDERERTLKALSTKISLQKVGVETEMAELEAQQIEFEEAQKDANAETSSESEDFTEERIALNSARLELEARIQDLERNLDEEKQKVSPQLIDEESLLELREALQDSKDTVDEKNFLIQQREQELENLKGRQDGLAENTQIEELEQDKQLLEIEKFKLQEKLDRIDLEKRDLDASHNKHQREIQVERRDAEISLREMQTVIKEEQLKQKVEHANLKEEQRSFDLARQNFQEDVQDLQAKQAELRKMESYLQEKEQSINAGAATSLPERPDSSAMEPFKATSTPPQAAESIDTNLPSSEPTQPNGEGPNEPSSPDKWSKPDFEKKAGRGPLRIGRRSSF